MKHRKILAVGLAMLSALAGATALAAEKMDQMWGEFVIKLRAADARRGQLFADGNYAMLIHWGCIRSSAIAWTAKPTTASANES